MFDPAVYDGPVRAWVAVCGDPGPYCIRRPTPKNPHRLEVLRCTRPASHPGGFHQYAEADRGVIAQWDRSGKPDFPLIIQPGPTPDRA